MKLIVGLGNPGEKYSCTRHNAGFMVMDRLAEKAGVEINKNKFEAQYVKTRIKGEDVILLKPMTYMNNSGFAVRACMDFFKIEPKDLLVIYDDLDTPVGAIRLKPSGSAGGHNGMKSVISAAMGQDFDRIRVGIGRDPKIKIIDYVLTRFRADEMDDLNAAIDQAVKAAWFSIDHGFTQAMNRYNVKPKKKKSDPEAEKLAAALKKQNAQTFHSGKKDVLYQEETGRSLSDSAIAEQLKKEALAAQEASQNASASYTYQREETLDRQNKSEQ